MQLAKKLNELEGQLVHGGRNILDTYTERQLELEKKLTEIAERKKREVEMQQQLELQEETTLEIRETLTSVQQEVELKTKKLKKCYTKYMVSSGNVTLSIQIRFITDSITIHIGFEARASRYT